MIILHYHLIKTQKSKRSKNLPETFQPPCVNVKTHVDMKTKDYLYLLLMVVLSIAMTYAWCLVWNDIYNDGARTFFLRNRMEDILDTVWAAINEEFIWRLVPLIIISYVLAFFKYESSKPKKYTLCSIGFIIVVIISIYFGLAHYNKIAETEEWKIRHIELQGTMGLIFATAYNLIQQYLRRICKIKLLWSHLAAYLSTTIIHMTVNTLIIFKLTF